MVLHAGAAPSGFDNAMMPLAETNMFVQIIDTPSQSSSLDFLQSNLPTTRNGPNEASPVHRPLDGVDMATDGSKADNISLGAFTGSLTSWETPSYPLPRFQSPPIMERLGQPMEESFSDVFDYNGLALSPTAILKDLFPSVDVESQEFLTRKESLDPERRDSPSTTREGSREIFNTSERLDTALISQSGASSLLSRSLTSTDSLGEDPEIIIPILQLLENRILTGLDGSPRNLLVISSGRSRFRLQGALMSDWLLADLDSVMHWAYRRAADRRSNHTLSLTDAAYTLERDGQPEFVSKKNTTAPIGKVSSQLVIRSCPVCSDGGTFRAELRDLPNANEKEHRGTANTVTLSYTPGPQWHKTGVSITFRRAFEAGSSIHIPPSIKTFNVVPYDAEIVLLVWMNDLNGVRKLFEMGKASPTDVTPLGHSMLSVRKTLAKTSPK